jgi:hypothetical protein
MVNFILFVFFVLTFGAGWWCGKTYRTLGEMVDGCAKTLKSWLA